MSISRPMVTTFIAASLAWGCGGDNGDAAESAEPGVVGRAPPASGGVPSVVMLEPIPPQAFATPTDLAVMDQFAMAFSPAVLVARAGRSAWRLVALTNAGAPPVGRVRERRGVE